MDGITWDEMFGMPYESDLDPAKGIKVDLRKKKSAAPAPMVTAMKKALGKALVPAKLEAVGQGAVTPHTAGAAIDIHYNSKSPNKDVLAFAHGLISLFIKHKDTLKFGVVLYNNMQFTTKGGEAKNVGHEDHVHIDWIDYGTVVRNKAFASFKFIDDHGAEQTKVVKDDDQKTKMLWGPGARGGATTDFEAGLDELNKDFPTIKGTLETMKLADFQALYPPPTPPTPPTPTPTPEKHTDSTWFDEEGDLVHPDAPAGGSGLGHFRKAGTTAPTHAKGGLPHPKSPAGRRLDPIEVQRFVDENDVG